MVNYKNKYLKYKLKFEKLKQKGGVLGKNFYDNEEDAICDICLEPINDGTDLSMCVDDPNAPSWMNKCACGHYFHRECIKKWTQSKIDNNEPVTCVITRKHAHFIDVNPPNPDGTPAPLPEPVITPPVMRTEEGTVVTPPIGGIYEFPNRERIWVANVTQRDLDNNTRRVRLVQDKDGNCLYKGEILAYPSGFISPSWKDDNMPVDMLNNSIDEHGRYLGQSWDVMRGYLPWEFS